MDFEWNEAKAESNLTKHGIAFEGAIRVFLDPGRLEAESDTVDYGEARIVTIGMVEGVVLSVVYTWRGGRRRLISARKANRQERRRYETGQA